MTDFLSKSEESNYAGRILDGIHLHRKIDSYTDTHPNSRELRALLRKRHGKYASVVVDLIWDYFLSTHWDKYASESLEDFNKRIYEILIRRKADLPSKLNSKIENMVANDFLMAYANEQNMKASLQWMDKRAKFNSAFGEATKDIAENHQTIAKLFDSFFPDVLSYTKTYCSC